MSDRAPRTIAVMALAILAMALVSQAGPPASANPHRGSVLYTGRGKGVKKVSFRLKGHELLEDTVVVIESCTTRRGGRRQRYRGRMELEEASPRWPLRVDRHGRFH